VGIKEARLNDGEKWRKFLNGWREAAQVVESDFWNGVQNGEGEDGQGGRRTK